MRGEYRTTKALLGLVTLLLLAGCQTIDVYDSGGTPGPKGIPFYTKQPVRIQEMTYATPATNVQIDVVVATDPPTVHSYPESPVNVIGADKRITEIGDELGKKIQLKGETLQDVINDVEVSINEILELSATSKPEDASSPSVLIANTYHVDSELLGHKYFINSKNPLIGSATVDYHLNADGSLGEASSTVSDQTASTLIGLVPVSAFLTKQWNLSAPAAAQSTTPATVTTQAFAKAGHFVESPTQLLGLKVQPQNGAVTPPAFIVRLKRSPDRRVYLLRKVSALPDGGPTPLQVLTNAQAMSGVADGSIQLVRIATESQLAAQSKAAPEKKDDAKPAKKTKDK